MKASGLSAACAVLCLAATAHADQASDAFDAWSAAFQGHDNGQTFYSGYPVGKAPSQRPAGWADALAIELAEDVYERRHTSAHRKLIDDLVTSFLDHDGAQATDWCVPAYTDSAHWKDGWNDDLGWMITGVLHAYQITGNARFLTVARDTWNCAYDRGWDTHYAGGGIWEKMDDVGPTFAAGASKCALSNDPFIINGVLLFQITGDQAYLDKAKKIYAWMHEELFIAATGEVRGCVGFDNAADTIGHVEAHDDNAYNDGTFLQGAAGLYRVTGEPSYLDDALLVIKHRVTKDAIMHSGDEGSDSEWAYPFMKGLGRLATFNGLWQDYSAWVTANANAAWSKRNSLNVTWNDWTTTTPEPVPVQSLDVCRASPHPTTCDITPLDTRSAVGAWQFLPQSADPELAGTFEIENVASHLSLTVKADDSGAPIVVHDTSTLAASFAWTLVPTTGAYVRIQNAATTAFASVDGSSGRAGAGIVATAKMPYQGSDQWLPVKNEDGTYSFYNLSSLQALDDPASDTKPGTQYVQWFGNGAENQRFLLHRQIVDAGNAEDAGPEDASSADDAEALDASTTKPPAGDAHAGADAADTDTDTNPNNRAPCSCRAPGRGGPLGGTAGIGIVLACVCAIGRRSSSVTNGAPRTRGAKDT